MEIAEEKVDVIVEMAVEIVSVVEDLIAMSDSRPVVSEVSVETEAKEVQEENLLVEIVEAEIQQDLDLSEFARQT